MSEAMSDSGPAIFLSYASQDAGVVKGLADALRAAGVEVWFDQNELVGGDAWDSKIRKQIKECALFLPVVSANTQARREGYFRIEWKLAAQRTHAFAEGTPFLFPIVIDATRDAEALVPEEFRAVQWTRLSDGASATKFSARIKKLLEGETIVANPRPAERSLPPSRAKKSHYSQSRWLPALAAILLVAGLASWQPWRKAGSARESGLALSLTPALSNARQLAVRAQALAQLNELTREKLGAAEELIAQALKLDPTDAEGWATAAGIDALMVHRGFDISDERRQSAFKRAARALALDPGNFAARRSRVLVDGLLGNSSEMRAEAEAGYRTLLQERPADNDLREELGAVLVEDGNFAEAAAVFVQAGRLLPASRAYAREKRYDEARQLLDGLLAEKRSPRALVVKANVELFGFGNREAAQALVNQLSPTELGEDEATGIALRVAIVQRDPAQMLKLLGTFPDPFVSLGGDVNYPRQYWSGFAQILAHQPDAAQAEWHGALRAITERLKSNPHDPESLGWSAVLHALVGETEAAEQALRLYQGYRKLTPGEWDWWYDLTLLYIGGHNDEVLGTLEKNFRSADSFNRILYIFARYCPEFDALRGDPRFDALLRDTLPKGMRPFEVPVVVDTKSVAVLAFTNLSDDKDNEYFSDGISEELLNVLAKIPDLKVAARTSAFYFKGRETPVPEIAQKLGVAFVVEGSVRKQGNRVRITAQLIKASDGFHVWSDTFTRDLKDVFAVQDEIAELIARNISPVLNPPKAGSSRTLDPVAIQEYLAGRAAMAKSGMADLREAVIHFEKAVVVEPKFTAAWVQLASAHTQLGRWAGAPTLSSWKAARAAIDQARAIEPDSPEVLLALGWILRTSDWDWHGAEQAFRRALQLRPNQPEILAGTAVLLFNIGKTDEAFRLGRQAVLLDPLNASTQIDLSLMFFFNDNWAEAEQSARRALQLAPGGTSYHSILAWSLLKQGKYAEAEAEAALDSDVVEQPTTLGLIAIARGQGAKVREMVVRLEDIARANPDSADLQNCIAWLQAGLGEKDRAFAALEKARASRDPSMSWLRNGSYLSALFSDPRWHELLQQAGLTDEQLK